MEFLSSAITPAEHQATHSNIVATDSSGMPLLQNMNDLSVINSVAGSFNVGANMNGNMTNQMTVFPNGIVSPNANSTVASNPPPSQLTGHMSPGVPDGAAADHPCFLMESMKA